MARRELQQIVGGVPAVAVNGRRNQVNERINFTLKGEQKMELLKLFPGVNFVSTREDDHPHPVSALVRKLLERQAIEMLHRAFPDVDAQGRKNLVIVDVGGNPIRHKAQNRPYVWSCCPILDKADVVRNAQRSRYNDLLYCNHKVQDCFCQGQLIAGRRYAETYLLVHSIYYLEPLDLLTLVYRSRKHCVISVNHMFSGFRGNMACNEGSWVRDGNQIKMSVHGNSHDYVHKNVDWLYAGYFEDPNTRRAMAWTVQRNCGDSVIIEFVTAPLGLSGKILTSVRRPLVQALEDDKYVGYVDVRGPLAAVKSYHAVAELMTFKIKDVFSVSGSLSFQLANSITVTLPSGCIGAVRIKTQGMAYDAKTYQLALSYAANYLVKIPGYNPDEIADACPLVAACAMGINRSYGTKVLAELQDPGWFGLKDSATKVYNGYLRFERPKAFGYIVINFLLMLWIAICCWISPMFLKLTIKSMGFGSLWDTVLVLLEWLLSWAAPGMLLSSKMKMKHQASGQPTGTIVTYPLTEQYEDVCMECKNTGPVDSTAKIVIPALHPKCDPGFGNMICGPCLYGYEPVVARSCVHNEIVAVFNRACKAKPPLSYALEAAYEQYIRDHGYLLSNLDHHWKDVDIAKFMHIAGNREMWLSRFPLPKQKLLRKAYDDSNVPGAEHKRDVTSQAFVKRENQIKCVPFGVIPFDPRLIQGRSFIYSAVLGPWIWAFSKFLQSAWNPNEVHEIDGFSVVLVYAGGLNAVQLGVTVHGFITNDSLHCMIIVMGDDSFVLVRNSVGHVIIICTDCNRWDATYHDMAINFENEVYNLFNPDARKRLLLHEQLVTKGVTKNGVKYSVNATRKSGDPNTSCGNSYRNATQTWYAVLKSKVLNNNHNFQALYDGTLQGLGFSPVTSVYDVDLVGADFCSSYFYPAIVNGFETHILGPKIGRALIKTFWAITYQTAPLAWAQAVSKGLLNRCKFIPILRKFVEHPLKFMCDDDVVYIPSYDHKFEVPDVYEIGLCEQIYPYLHKLYGLTHHMVDELEAFIEGWTQPVVRAWHPYFQLLIDKDCDVESDVHITYGSIPLTTLVAFIILAVLGIWRADSNCGTDTSVSCLLRNWLRLFDGFPLHVVVFAPIYEELIKVWLPGSVHFIVGFELLRTILGGINVQSAIVAGLVYWLTTGGMHYYAYSSGLYFGILIHMMWNLLVYLKGG